MNTHLLHGPKSPIANVPTGTRARWALEVQANALLHAAGAFIPTGDAMVPGVGLQVTPDPITRATIYLAKRWPSPVRHEQAAPMFWADSDGQTTKVTLLPTTFVGRGVRHVGCVGDGWFGHREDVTPRNARTVKRATRKSTTAKMGRPTTWFTMSDRSLPRRWEQATDLQRAMVDRVEQVLRTSTHDEAFTLCDGWSVLVDQANATVRKDEPNSRVFAIRNWSKRFVLAGHTID